MTLAGVSGVTVVAIVPAWTVSVMPECSAGRLPPLALQYESQSVASRHGVPDAHTPFHTTKSPPATFLVNTINFDALVVMLVGLIGLIVVATAPHARSA